jgi:hypothetical protein
MIFLLYTTLYAFLGFLPLNKFATIALSHPSIIIDKTIKVKHHNSMAEMNFKLSSRESETETISGGMVNQKSKLKFIKPARKLGLYLKRSKRVDLFLKSAMVT